MANLHHLAVIAFRDGKQAPGQSPDWIRILGRILSQGTNKPPRLSQKGP